jgi:hypothetical protein
VAQEVKYWPCGKCEISFDFCRCEPMKLQEAMDVVSNHLIGKNARTKAEDAAVVLYQELRGSRCEQGHRINDFKPKHTCCYLEEKEARRKPSRYILEGTWSGYRSSQSRVCHRTIIKPYQAKRYEKITGVRFGDGTSMTITVRPAKVREQVKEIHGYNDILTRAYYRPELEGFVDIDKLGEKWENPENAP